MAMAVDPAFVASNGGVTAGRPNGALTTTAMGTGFYELQSWVPGQSVSLVKNPNYWGAKLPKSELNNAIRAGDSEQHQSSTTSLRQRASPTSALGAAQMIFVPVTYYNVTNGLSGVTTRVLSPAFGSAEAVTMCTWTRWPSSPSTTPWCREAIAYGIDYQVIIKDVFAGHAIQWVGPVPPGFQYYNESTAGLSPYQFNATKAAELLAQAGYVSHLPNGITLNPGGKPFPSVNFLYDSDSPTDTQAAQIIASNLRSIGIPVNPRRSRTRPTPASSTPLPPIPRHTRWASGFYSEDYTASIDYVYYFTSDNYIGTSNYADANAIAWTLKHRRRSDSSTVISSFQQHHPDYVLQLHRHLAVRGRQMTVNQNRITGMIPNPAGSAAGYFLYFNTISYSS